MNELGPIDPLRLDGDEYSEILISAKKREIGNIIKSYVSPYDLFSEAIQNALDSIDRKRGQLAPEEIVSFVGNIDVYIDLDKDELIVRDNGTGFDEHEFKAFVAPNMSFNKGNDKGTRGNKGVGASYLAFGFDYFCVNTKSSNFSYCGELNKGRSWVDGADVSETPKLISSTISENMNIENHGAAVLIRVGGANTKPKTLRYFTAHTPEEWSYLLRAKTPLGSIDRDTDYIDCNIFVTKDGVTDSGIFKPGYPFPQEFINSALNIDDYRAWQSETVNKGGNITNVPAKFRKRTGVYKYYSEEEILRLGNSWEPEHETVLRLHSVNAYAVFMHSTDVWDIINDKKMKLRKGMRIIRGGLLIANNGMTQGEYLVIPLTSSIGYQKQCHIIVHLTNADPDLGRKGFQPEVKEACEEVSKRIINNSLKRYRDLLKPNGKSTSDDEKEKKLADWIKEQERFQEEHPLKLTSEHFFKPKNEISISSIPQKEQDVIALFNQLIAGGVIRSINLLATNQTTQYDGVYRYVVSEDEETYLHDSVTNPLGLEHEKLKNFESQPKVLEYKHNLDYLIQDFHNEEKRADDINLAICWELGSSWREDFECTSYLLEDNIAHRSYHGLTHQLYSSTSKIDVIVLSELIEYLEDYERSQKTQITNYELDE
ncbi:ATP-binding protein [Oceanospirillum sanctuarii]|uniref:ATP-binding protein n=1 Tax=Oceanospirillum sanctuarii TaxID=1434821 RepID=UPI000A3C742E|nr:ATP-binding protein [Oceanospirillum sanctuarii]